MITVEKNNKIATLTLNRPDVKNALNSQLIENLNIELNKLKLESDVRVIIITGAGDTFCSGADLKWLRDVSHFSFKENYDESMRFIDLLNLINNHPKPIIARVNGTAVGGGVGIMLASDIIFASRDAKFGLSEVAIGIVPAAIIHFLINRIGETKARELLITGNRIDTIEAESIGLINYTADLRLIDKGIKKLTDKIIRNGPKAITKVKEMINTLPHLSAMETNDFIAKEIAELRTSDEGQEGISSFLEKRKPRWVD